MSGENSAPGAGPLKAAMRAGRGEGVALRSLLRVGGQAQFNRNRD